MAVGNNQMGPGGPAGDQYEDTKMDPVITKPFGGGYYTGSGSQAGNTQGNNVLTPEQRLNQIVNQKSVWENKAGLPAYLKRKHKFYDRMTKDGQAIPYDEMTEAQKSIHDFYAPSTPTAYQQQIHNFITGGDENVEAYKDKFPIGGRFNLAMTTLPDQIMGNTLWGKMLEGFSGGAKKTGEGLDSISNQIGGTLEGLKSLLPTNWGGKNLPPQTEEPKFNRESYGYMDAPFGYNQGFPQSGYPRDFSIPSQITDDVDFERVFKLPSDFRGGFDNSYFLGIPPSIESYKDNNYLVRQPDLNALMGMNLNQGGLASLNNLDYQPLKAASNFNI
jgi:hypothetical protein|tara:strand:+ start:268 stop:1260 length:993 start_codon:yes stop_codon:yes gene_type:complete